MTWNYRVVRCKYDYFGDPQYTQAMIYEVYYEDHRPVSMTEEPVSPAGNTPEEFLNSWKYYKTALEKPILIFDMDAEIFIGEKQWKLKASFQRAFKRFISRLKRKKAKSKEPESE